MMNMDGIFVRDGKVVLRDLPNTCEAGAHVFNKGKGAPCDCGAHPSFDAADAICVAKEEPLSQEPVLRKKHLALILGGKK